MKFNSFQQLGGPEARELRDSILGAFYARYPDVQKAVSYDSASFGELTEKTRALVRQALDRDAAMRELARPLCTEDDGSLEPVFPEQIARARWPEETIEHRAMRAAFCEGAALASQPGNPNET